MFLFEAFFVCFLIFFKLNLNQPGSLTHLSAQEFSSTRKFIIMGLLTFTIFIFFDDNIFKGIIFRKEFSLFSKMV